VMGELRDAIITRWLDPEHAPVWAKPEPKAAPQTRYWGDN